MAGRGLQFIPFDRVPDKWDRRWFVDFMRDVLRFADVRNAIEGAGIQITGEPFEEATISTSTDIQNLLLQSYVLATPSAFLPNERVLTGWGGITTVYDGGAGNPIEVRLETHGVPFEYMQEINSLSVLGNPGAAQDQIAEIQAAQDGDVLCMQGGGLQWTSTPTWTGFHKWVDSVGAYFGTGDDADIIFNGTDFLISSDTAMALKTNGVERLRFSSAGEWSVGADGIGTAGQVLTSGGPAAQPTWETPSAGGTSIPVQDEGTPVVTATTLNFVGAGVTASNGGSGVATITIPGGSGGSTQVDIISAGTSWSKPAGAKMIDVVCIGGGGGGGSGRKHATSQARCGGGGGGGGGYSRLMIPATLVGSSVTVAVGAGGGGGAAQATNSTAGNPGISGGDSSFGTFIKATGGGAGGGGAAVGGTAGAVGLGLASDGGIGSIGAGSGASAAPTSTKMGGGGGGIAGGVTTGNAQGAGGAGADGPTMANTAITGGTLGAAGGSNGGAGSAGTTLGVPGAGGGGGGGNSTAGGTGGTGGAGGGYGGGGGAGGGSTNPAAGSTGASGAGGAGADGVVIVITHF